MFNGSRPFTLCNIGFIASFENWTSISTKFKGQNSESKGIGKITARKFTSAGLGAFDLHKHRRYDVITEPNPLQPLEFHHRTVRNSQEVVLSPFQLAVSIRVHNFLENSPTEVLVLDPALLSLDALAKLVQRSCKFFITICVVALRAWIRWHSPRWRRGFLRDESFADTKDPAQLITGPSIYLQLVGLTGPVRLPFGKQVLEKVPVFALCATGQAQVL